MSDPKPKYETRESVNGPAVRMSAWPMTDDEEYENQMHVPYTGKPYRPDYYRPQRKNPRIDPSADVSDVVHAWDVKDHRVASAIERLLRAGKKPGESFLKDLHKSMEEIHRAIEFAEMEQGESE